MKIHYRTPNRYTDYFLQAIINAFGPYSRETYDPNNQLLTYYWAHAKLTRRAIGRTCFWITQDPGTELWLTLNMPEGAEVLSG